MQRVALVTVELEGNVTHARLREMTSKHPREVTLALHGLVQRGLLQSSGQHRSTAYTWPPSLLSDRTKVRQAPSSELSKSRLERSAPNSELSRPMLERSGPSSELSGPMPEQGEPSSELSRPMLEQGGLNSEPSTTPLEDDAAEWAELERLAAPFHATKRARRNVAESVLLTLCRGRYLTLDQLARLTKRGTDSLRTRYLNRMVDDGRLRLRYPDTPNHPRQAYTCADSALASAPLTAARAPLPRPPHGDASTGAGGR